MTTPTGKILPIVLYGNPILRKKGRPAGPVTDELRQLAADMLETMRAAEGVGLAAQQVGLDLQLTVIDIPAETERPSRMWIGDKPVPYADYMPLVLLDPVITTTKTKEEGSEGCLSFPGISADIRRGARVKVRCRRLDGKPFAFDADGLLGRAVQHEVDHLNGVLFIDHLDSAARAELKPLYEAIRQQGAAGQTR